VKKQDLGRQPPLPQPGRRSHAMGRAFLAGMLMVVGTCFLFSAHHCHRRWRHGSSFPAGPSRRWATGPSRPPLREHLSCPPFRSVHGVRLRDSQVPARPSGPRPSRSWTPPSTRPLARGSAGEELAVHGAGLMLTRETRFSACEHVPVPWSHRFNPSPVFSATSG